MLELWYAPYEKSAVKKTLVSGLIILLLIAAFNNIEVATGGSDQIVFSLQFDMPVIESIEIFSHSYHSVDIADYPKLSEPGKPVLPMKTVNVLIPYGKTIKEINILPSKEVILPGTYSIEPGQMPRPINDDAQAFEVLFTPPNDKIYAAQFPSVLFDYTTQMYRGYQLLLLTVYPVQHHEGKLSYVKEMTLEIELESEMLTTKNYRGGRLEGIKRLSLIDPEEVYLYPDPDPTGDMDIYEYVIITTSEFSEAFQRLADWKETRGQYTPYYNLTTNIVLLEDIVSNRSFWYDGYWGDGGGENVFNDTQCQIRNFIKMAYTNWSTEYVLLGGDADEPIIPCRVLSYRPSWGTLYDIPGDLYFGGLDGNWNNDGDEYFGESASYSTGEETDFFTEVYIGRAPVDDLDEVNNLVDKIIAYENATAHNDGYLQNALMIGDDLQHPWCGAGNTKDTVTSIIPQYNTTKLYYKDGTSDHDRIKEAMEKGTHIVNRCGHNNGLVDPYTLTNDEYFLVYNTGCHSADFDQGSCWAKFFVVATGGAFAYIGNSRYGWKGPSDDYDRSFYKVLMNTSLANQTTNIGKILQHSKEKMMIEQGFPINTDRFIYFTLNLFGDPETQIKTTVSEPTARFDTPADYGENLQMPPIYEGNIAIEGMARRGNAPGSTFDHYTIEYGLGVDPISWSSDDITLADGGSSEVIQGTLATLDTSQLHEGYNTLRLMVYDEDGNSSRDYIRFIVSRDNETVCNLDSNVWYWTIQSAVDDADPGDTILVGSGYYYEEVTIDKPLTLLGEDRDTTILDAFRTILTIQAEQVTIRNVTILHSGPSNTGIQIESNNNTIVNTVISNSSKGIFFSSSSVLYPSGNIITKNMIRDNLKGLYLNPSSKNTILMNDIVNNTGDGIFLSCFSDDNIISENTIKNNKGIGIDISWSTTNNRIYHNNFINNTQNANDRSNNIWDNGGYSNGNYWSDYVENGGYDSNDDGVGDTPYTIYGNTPPNQDNYPLMSELKQFSDMGLTTCPKGDGFTYRYLTVTVNDSRQKDSIENIPAEYFGFTVAAAEGTQYYGKLACAFIAIDNAVKK